MRLFKVTACIPSPEKVRTQRELQNTFFTKWVPYDSWFAEQQRIQKQGGRIIKVELCTGGQQVNVGNRNHLQKCVQTRPLVGFFAELPSPTALMTAQYMQHLRPF